MAFATKYKIHQILAGVALGAALNHGLAIAFGTLLNRYLPLDMLQLVAGLLFVFFALWSLKAEAEEDEEIKSAYGPLITVAIAFFLGELGDKTQLTALTLSAGSAHPWFVLAGTVSGMVLTSFIGIMVGIKLGNKIKELYLKLGAYAIFMFFGLQKIIVSPYTAEFSMMVWIAILGLMAGISYFRIQSFQAKLRSMETTAFIRRAELLRIFSSTLRDELDTLCKGLDECNHCMGEACLVGYMKAVLDHAKRGEFFDKTRLMDIEKLIDKSFDRQKAQVILALLMSYYESVEAMFNNTETDVFGGVRKALERIIFGAPLGDFETFMDYQAVLKQKDSRFGLKKL